MTSRLGFLLISARLVRPARRRSAFGVVLVIVVLPFLASGETHNHEMTPTPSPIGSSLSLEQVTKTALANNPAIKAARATWQAKRQRIEQQAAWEDSKLSFRSLLGRFVEIGPNGFTDQMVSLEQAIPLSGKNRSQARIAVAEAVAAFQDLRRQELDVVAKVRTSFFRLASYYALLELNRANEVSLEQTLEISREKYEVGNQTQSDVLLAETERQKIIEARKDLEQKVSDEESALKVLMNADPFQHVGRPVVPNARPGGPSTEALRALTLANRPEILRAESELVGAQGMLQLAKRQWFPDPMVMIEADHYNASSRLASEVSAGVSFSLPWPNAKKYNAGEREAQDQIAAAEQMLEGAKTESLGKLRDQLQMIETMHHHLELYEKSILPTAGETVSSNQADYETGKTGFLNVLSSQRSLYDFEMMYQQDLTDYRVALAELEALVGSNLGYFDDAQKPKKAPQK